MDPSWQLAHTARQQQLAQTARQRRLAHFAATTPRQLSPTSGHAPSRFVRNFVLWVKESPDPHLSSRHNVSRPQADCRPDILGEVTHASTASEVTRSSRSSAAHAATANQRLPHTLTSLIGSSHADIFLNFQQGSTEDTCNNRTSTRTSTSHEQGCFLLNILFNDTLTSRGASSSTTSSSLTTCSRR